MEAYFFDVWEMMQTLTQFADTNTANSRIPWKFKSGEPASAFRIKLAQFKNSLVANILALNVETLGITCIDVLPKLNEIAIGDLDDRSIKFADGNFSVIIGIAIGLILCVFEVEIRQVIEGQIYDCSGLAVHLEENSFLLEVQDVVI